MSDSYVVSIRSLGNEIGSQETFSLHVAPCPEWSSKAVQWTQDRVPIEVSLQNISEGVLVGISGSFTWESVCSRCAEPITRDFELNTQNVFFEPSAQAVQDAEEDEEIYLISASGDEIDLEPLVRDELVLGVPAAPVCNSDCEGLCQECGTPWAELEDTHSHDVIDPRWAALSNLADDSSDSSENE